MFCTPIINSNYRLNNYEYYFFKINITKQTSINFFKDYSRILNYSNYYSPNKISAQFTIPRN